MALLTGADLLGIVGLVLLLGGFVGNAFGRLAATSATYQALNAVGSGILAVYSVLIAAWVFFPLEVVWAAVAGYALAKNLRARSKA